MILWNIKPRNLLLVCFMCGSYGDYTFKDFNSNKTMQNNQIRQYENSSNTEEADKNWTVLNDKEIQNISISQHIKLIQNKTEVIDWSNTTKLSEKDKWCNSTEKIDNKKDMKNDKKLCVCRSYSCRCCINFSFIKRWPAVGCFNIQSLSRYLNLVMSFSFNKRRLAYFPIMGSNPRPFCKRLSIHHVYTCLYVYDIHIHTKHDISLCLYMEVSHGVQPLVTIHLDCIRQFNHHLSLIPIRRPKRKGFIDIHIAKNDTAFTILKQVFHIPRKHRKKRRQVHHSHKFWHVPKFVNKFLGSEMYYL